MKSENNKTIIEKLGILTSFIKNIKFLVLTIIAIGFLGVAIFSGSGKDIALNLYESITGQRYQNFSPVEDYTNETYAILKDKISREKDIGIDNSKITIFQESDDFHRYRVESKDKVYFYNVKKKQNGIWHINKE